MAWPPPTPLLGVLEEPAEPCRRAGLVLAARLEEGVTAVLTRDENIAAAEAVTLARVVTAIVHIGATATMYTQLSDEAVLADLRHHHSWLRPSRIKRHRPSH